MNHKSVLALLVGLVLCVAAACVALPSCDDCVAVITPLVKFGDNATYVGDVIAELKKKCAHDLIKYPSLEKVCEALASTLEVIPELEKALKDLAWPNLPTAICSTLIWSCKVDCCVDDVPEQVRLSVYPSAAPPTDTQPPLPYAVDWVSRHATGREEVRLWKQGQDPSSYIAHKATHRTYRAGGWTGNLFHAPMGSSDTNEFLEANTNYTYIVGVPAQSSAGGRGYGKNYKDGVFSEEFTFSTMPARVGMSAATPGRPFRMAVIGDMGWGESSAKDIAQLTSLAETGRLDLVFHNGDVGYADGYQRQWDVYGRLIQPITTRVPYVATAGNHEFWFNFTAYKTRFMSPSFISQNTDVTDSPMYWKLNIHSLMTLVGGNSESPVDTPYISSQQLAFIKDAVEKSHSQQSFTITASHRPVYCAGTSSDCGGPFSSYMRARLEDAYQKADLVIGAHVHLMERSYPVSGGVVMQRDYVKPKAPTYIVMGASGNREGNRGPHDAPFKAWGSSEVGIGLMEVYDKNLNFKFVSEGGKVLDEFTITK